LDDANIFSLLIGADGKLLIGTGGETGDGFCGGKNGAKPAEIFYGRRRAVCVEDGADAGWKYLCGHWAERVSSFEIRPDGSRSEQIFSSESKQL